MRTATIRLVLLAALAAAGPALAQEAAPSPLEDPRAPKFPDVERGLFVGLEVGWPAVLLETPTQDPERFPYAQDGGGTATGHAVGLQLGYDVTSRVAVSLFGEGWFMSADASYGAFDLLAVGLDGRYAFYGRKDRNGWDRLFVYAHARGAWLWSNPTGLFADTDVMLGAGVGVEYFAQLRHFSVWAQVDGSYVLTAGTPGAGLLAGVRYTF